MRMVDPKLARCPICGRPIRSYSGSFGNERVAFTTQHADPFVPDCSKILDAIDAHEFENAVNRNEGGER